MNSPLPESTISSNAAAESLAALCRPFAPREFIPEFEIVSPQQMSDSAKALLVHENHMTIELQNYYGKSVDVHVLTERREDKIYTRKVTLTLTGTGRIVEWGIARMNFAFLSPQIQTEILARQTPLGAILVQHQIHRRISPRHFLKFPTSSRVVELFGGKASDQPVYGRLGSIYCDERPAIDLLEIVSNPDSK